MIEHLKPSSVRDRIKVKIGTFIADMDTRLADSLNPPETDYPRFYDYEMERPVAKEEDLE